MHRERQHGMGGFAIILVFNQCSARVSTMHHVRRAIHSSASSWIRGHLTAAPDTSPKLKPYFPFRSSLTAPPCPMYQASSSMVIIRTRVELLVASSKTARKSSQVSAC